MVSGLLWRRPELGLPWPLAKYGGSALWGAMVFFIVAGAIARRRPIRGAVVAAALVAMVEISQAIHFEPLDRFRATALGALLLGRTFDWWDIAAYWAGIGMALLATTLATRAHVGQSKRAG
ncbi:DUF2809 domain-containing protein [Hansschlegelia plantiphila]|nr:DUF2809 domain-containing protein [Hansschlegelia plantiphila]